MINLLKQSVLFITANLATGWFKYFFVVINFIPFVLYFAFGFTADNLIMYFVLEAIAYCFMNIIFLKLIDLPLVVVKFILVLLSLSLIALATYFIPSWNSAEQSESRIAFWNYAAILFSFYTINFFTIGYKFYDWDESILKRNVILKFGILAFVAIAGTLLSKLIKSDIAFLCAMIGTKTIIDFAALRKYQTTR